MKWFDSFTLVMRSNITTLREKVEDPERMLHQLIIDMQEELERIRHSVAEAMADEIQLRKQVARTREEAEQWMERATVSLRRGDESGAKAALEQKVMAEQRADALEQEYHKHKEQVEELHRSVRELEDKIRQAKQKQTLLLARMVRAESKENIQHAMNRANSRSAFAHFDRLEKKIEHSEAMNEAYKRLDGVDPDAEELKRHYEGEERKRHLEQELEALKQRLQDPGASS